MENYKFYSKTAKTKKPKLKPQKNWISSRKTTPQTKIKPGPKTNQIKKCAHIAAKKESPSTLRLRPKNASQQVKKGLSHDVTITAHRFVPCFPRLQPTAAQH